MTDLPLRTCPWCGELPRINPWPSGELTSPEVACDNAECPVKPNVFGDTLAEAITRWNERKVV